MMDVRQVDLSKDTKADALAYAIRLEVEAAAARERVAHRVREEAETLENARKEQERRNQEAAAKAAEVERRRLEVDAALAVPMPTGAVHCRQYQGHNEGIDVQAITAAFGLVMINSGKLRLPVITCTGHVSTVEGPYLMPHHLESQPLVVGTEHTIRAAFCALAVKTWADAIQDAEKLEPQNHVNDAGRVLYTAALPAVTVEPLADNPKLCRVIATWGEVFIYRNPSL